VAAVEPGAEVVPSALSFLTALSSAPPAAIEATSPLPAAALPSGFSFLSGLALGGSSAATEAVPTEAPAAEVPVEGDAVAADAATGEAAPAE